MAETFNSNVGGYQQAKYGSAISILIRMDGLFQLAHLHARHGEYEKWNIDLDRIFIELVVDAKQEDIDEFKENNSQIRAVGFIRDPETNKLKNISKLYDLLFKKEIAIRILQKKQGKGMAYEQSIDEYMD